MGIKAYGIFAICSDKYIMQLVITAQNIFRGLIIKLREFIFMSVSVFIIRAQLIRAVMGINIKIFDSIKTVDIFLNINTESGSVVKEQAMLRLMGDRINVDILFT